MTTPESKTNNNSELSKKANAEVTSINYKERSVVQKTLFTTEPLKKYPRPSE